MTKAAAEPGDMQRPRHCAAVLIPARLESTRLPRKLLLADTGKPLLAHTVERALAAKAASEGRIGRVIVAADDERLCEAARAAGAEAVLTRADHASGTDRIAEVAATIEEEFVVNVQGDEPEVEAAHVLAVACLLQVPEHDEDPMGTLAYPIADEAAFRNPNLVKVVLDRDGRALYFSRAPVPFPRDGTVPGRVDDVVPTTRPGRVDDVVRTTRPGRVDDVVRTTRPGRVDDVVRTTRQGAWGLAHIGLYVYRRDFLLRYSSLPTSALEEREKLEQLRALEAGERIRVAVVDPPRGAPIDTREGYDEFCRRALAEERSSG